MATVFMETSMQTLFSGLSEQASRAYVGTSFDDAFSIQWKSAAQFMAEVDSTNAAAARQRVWFYRAPWAWLADGPTGDITAALQQWQAEQRAVLQLRRILRQRLILVNIDRVPAQTLFERLGLAYNDEPQHLFADPLAATLAGVFEQMAPECWTLYEALEAASWLPNGEPEFRANRALPTHAGLVELLELVHAGRQLPNAQLQLHERDRAISVLRREAEQVRSAQHSRQDDRKFVNAQLQRAQQALTEQQAEGQLLKDQLAELKLQLTSTLADKQQGPQASEFSQTGSNALLEENQLLLAQLQQLQEELEKRHFESQASNEKFAKLNNELDQLRAAQQQAGLETANAQALSEENELLLSQLHLVQEELENYYLANREMLAAMDQSNHTLHRARKVISRVAAHV